PATGGLSIMTETGSGRGTAGTGFHSDGTPYLRAARGGAAVTAPPPGSSREVRCQPHLVDAHVVVRPTTGGPGTVDLQPDEARRSGIDVEEQRTAVARQVAAADRRPRRPVGTDRQLVRLDPGRLFGRRLVVTHRPFALVDAEVRHLLG